MLVIDFGGGGVEEETSKDAIAETQALVATLIFYGCYSKASKTGWLKSEIYTRCGGARL